ncbi:hypothetical protein jhhlp_001856 [Lomentospora prolificans]|uniref:ABC transporter domain-containing protein n=1 Tax=Lomentospora prolificans TaxID=41688 RepID=A0A2N3NCB5_9PEZI|nr:hypothetical protein jhhlp_001856 [Lomentospora prolificans]
MADESEDTLSVSGQDADLASSSTWAMKAEVEAMVQRDRSSGLPARELGVTWKNLTVKAISADAAIHDNLLSQFNVLQKIKDSRHKPPLKTILDNSHGCVKPGEMLLVLGRPGSGCTTLLSMLANRRRGYAEVSGDVHYGALGAEEAKKYRGQIVMNTEEELFFPTLTVGQTMDFATRLKVPFHLPSGVDSEVDYQTEQRDFLLRSMGIHHTQDTMVGNEFVRGVSGGERKRVSIIECLATKGSVFCWDNPTRGLDASTALDYTKALRAMTDVLGLATIVTVYQAGNGIYDLFDKVLVLDEGMEVYYGPLKEAKPFMENLGFVCQHGANVADFLTGVTVSTERQIRPGFESRFPRTAITLREEYNKSPIRDTMEQEYGYPSTTEAIEKTKAFQESVEFERNTSLPSNSPLTVGFMAQVKACVVRQYQIMWGSKVTFYLKLATTVIQALIAGSSFYGAPDNSAGLFVKSGACFLALLFNSLMSMSEVTDSFHGRPVIMKHKSFALFHPAAYCIAQIAADIPILLLQVSMTSVILYFMVGLRSSAGAFFTFWVLLVSVYMCMTAAFRAIGAAFDKFDGASKVSGLFVDASLLYSGYMIRKPQMHPWLGWIFWINPLSYAFDAVLSNEFNGRHINCVGTSLIPSGEGYTNAEHAACAGVGGAQPGKSYVLGDDYLSSLSYGHSHLWRNFGIVWAWWALFVAITVFATSRWRSASESGPSLLIPRENAHILGGRRPDEEASTSFTASKEKGNSSDVSTSGVDDDVEGRTKESGLMRNTSVFTWKNLTYTVKTPSGDRLLLDNVHGWVKPGMLTALMGSSGAGKTTLLDVLAQRKTEGTIRGSILVDGRPVPVSFQRSAGYCEQLDVHEPYATVREALEFSALLRQSRYTPREEKLKYVDTIIDLLELHDLADTLIGEVGSGLSVEQRKRVTIGVELVSKPSILIFLDEPTSGLDGQSAYNTVRFLRKLADAGQAVVVTIHQPSAQLFTQFDTLLLLAKGGKTVYFGDIGDNGKIIKNYFARYGAPCPQEANPAEHMIDVVSGHLSQGKDWNEVWLSSPEYKATCGELDHLIQDAAQKPPQTADDGHEFAQTLWEQIKLVTRRMNVSLYRNTDYVNNKFVLHTVQGLYHGFSFWMIGDSISDLQLKLFAIFNFVFVAPGVIAQLQPLFIQRRSIFEAREKKSKMYSWVAFVTGLIVSEIPYLCVCAVLYFVCWYYTVGFPAVSSRTGAIFFMMLVYEFLYTGIGQFTAAYAPNPVFASLVNPLLLGTLVMFCGVLVPYHQIQAFWRYWLYWIDPFNYLMGGMLVFTVWGSDITCDEHELALFDPPNGTTCGSYLGDYLQGAGSAANLLNPEARADCKVCSYSRGQDYLRTLNLNEYYYGWRNAGIVVIFSLSSYALVYGLMKLRTKTTKKAE